MIRRLQQRKWIAGLAGHVQCAELSRYVMVGAWNTLFGYASYVAFTILLTPFLPYAYILAGLLGSLLNITVAFLGYKWFVFKTKGRYLTEWVRCVGVYSTGIVLGTALLPPLVFVLGHVTTIESSAPYIAGALLSTINIAVGFLGHKKFSFSSPKARRIER